MKIIVGLGNPGPEYENTRHNLGFYFVDKFQKTRGLSPFSPLLGSRVSLNKCVDTPSFILCKPYEFMNDSGKTLWKILQQLKIPIDNILLIYDELDVPLGKFKVTKRKESQISHKGVKDIDNHFPLNKILKIKVGIGPQIRNNLIIKNYVMEKFSEEEQMIISQIEESIFYLMDKFISLPDNILKDPINYLLRK